MPRTPGLIVGALAGASLCAAAAPQWRPLGATPGFPALRRELQSRVDAGPGGPGARICVVLRDDGDGDPVLYALWPQARRLYRWTATREAALDDDTMVGHAPLDLRRDIARTPADRLSTYRVSQAWMDDVTAQCRAHGETLRFRRRPR